MNKTAFPLTIHLSARIALVMSLALAAMVFLTLLYSVWQWSQDWQLTQRPLQPETIMKATDKSAEIIATIPEEHLFGQPLTKLGEMPISDLQLQVTGIIKVEDGQARDSSKAFISISQRPSKIFKLGDSLPYGAKVYDITPEAVVIENNGHFEKLPLPRKTLQFKPALPKSTPEEPLE